MLVIINLLEDEQELSLGMLIRPKRIYNFCLLHASFVWYCYDIYALPYTFDHIWTNLLTQCTTVPVPVFCCFSISGFPHIKSALKILGEIQEKSAYRELQEKPKQGQRGARGSPGGPTPGRPRGAPGPPSPLLVPPFGIYTPRIPKPSRTEPFFAISSLFRRRRASKIGGPEFLCRHPAGTGKCPRIHLHRRCFLPPWCGSSSSSGLRFLPVAMWSILSPMMWSSLWS